MHKRLLAAPVAVLLAALGLVTALPASAAIPANCVVNSTGDQPNANTSVGCATATGTVTLRSAIELFNANSGTHAITFNLPSPSVITLTTSLDVNDAGTLTITGPGARLLAVDGNHSTRVFHIVPEGSVTVHISGLTIRNGSDPSDPGGGIYIQSGGTVTLDRVAITGNSAGGGGGIDHEGTSLTVTNSTLSGNRITGQNCWAGAAMETNGGNVVTTFINDTVTGNTADSSCSSGGAINMCDTATFTNVTISGNTGKGGALTGLGECNATTLKNTIIANQAGSPTVCLGPNPTDGGSNLSSDHSCGFTTGTPRFDLIDTNPMLAALANNGGPTDTMALTTGSPAIDAVRNTCPPPVADQRGVSRPQGSACDIGAFELSPLRVLLVTASCGPIAGGGSVTINGTGFLAATGVKFGATPAQSFTVVSNTQINAVAPAGTSGQKVDITVTTPAGTSTTSSPDQCAYAVLAATPTLPKAGIPPSRPGWSGPALLLVLLFAVSASVRRCLTSRR